MAPVISNEEVMPGVYLIWLKSRQIAAVVKPGQFVMVRCGKDNLLRRPFSVHRLDEPKGKLSLLYSVVGRGSHWLSQLGAGGTVDILGPLGNGFSINPSSKNLLLVGGGMGIAPLRFLADEGTGQGKKVTLLLGARTASHLCPGHLLPAELNCITATEDGSAGRRGMITECLPDFAGWADQIIACGPMPMYRSLKDIPQLKNKPVQISLEVRMACGLGVCYGCTIKTRKGLKQVCQDGPVFELEEVIWEELTDI